MNELVYFGVWSFFVLWPVYYAVIALVLLKEKISYKPHFFVISLLSCYGLEVCVKNFARRILKVTWHDYTMAIHITTLLLAVYLIFFYLQSI